jgi:type IV pilus assembly protein PilO
LLAEEKKLRTFFVSKQKLLVNINEYKEQMKTIESRLTTLVQLLPSANEVPSLVNQISQAGRESGLNFKEISMLPEKKFRYYVEMPIKMRVNGSYHQLGDFVSRVAELSRIVTFHDFTLVVNPEAQKQRIVGESLDLEILAKTYRYLAISESDNKGGANQKPGNKLKNKSVELSDDNKTNDIS